MGKQRGSAKRGPFDINVVNVSHEVSGGTTKKKRLSTEENNTRNAGGKALSCESQNDSLKEKEKDRTRERR